MKQISLAAARVNAGFTQQELADKMGVSRQSVMEWELGKRRIRPVNFKLFCVTTGFAEEDIFLPQNISKVNNNNDVSDS